ncbi:adenylyl-sulfate kinase [Micromonospora sp. WMMD1082]|uniref:adenylyl-sulfate kinase n=1 Tax=Micromonospora sp. WMMD1082 TaxID=3016104 RepID=UPI00241699D1|nr:adenylyl-sulfate kinase [Micromonospora sp. WMMD1082]MDG4795534.1 adenylyl-sulfate kinase [Micromonospora sp. WMMD1082]
MTALPAPVSRSAHRTTGSVIWITGLSGAGKSTVAAHLVPRLAAAGLHSVLLDGDELRAALGMVGTYDPQSRHRLAFVYARLCHLLARQGHTVVIATIALYHDVQAWNRTNLPNYLEVLLEVPLTELRRRNSKGVYGPDTVTPVVGVGIAPEFPIQPDLTVSNLGPVTPDVVAEQIFHLHETRRGDIR